MLAREAVPIENSIIALRNQRVILAADLARLYGVETRVLNQAVKRNGKKFPQDFMFRLTFSEVQEISRSRSQSVILKRGHNVKYLPYAFTEHGAIMAANVLNSPRAVQMSVFVVRAFVRLRQWSWPIRRSLRNWLNWNGRSARTMKSFKSSLMRSGNS
jgi:hypothetical protein